MLVTASHEEFVAALLGMAELPTLAPSDISLPGRSGIEGLRRRALLPAAEALT